LGEDTARAGSFAGAFILAAGLALEADAPRAGALFFAAGARFFEAAGRLRAAFGRADFFAAGFFLALPFAFDFTALDLFILLRDFCLRAIGDFLALRFEGFLAIRGSSEALVEPKALPSGRILLARGGRCKQRGS